MLLREELETVGNWIFKRRSYLPLILVVIVFLGLREALRLRGWSLPGEFWEAGCLATSFFGLGLRVITVGYVPEGTSGRNTDGQKAESLNTTGMYSIVRHPIYLGNFFVMLGISLFFGIWWLSLIFILAFALYYERVMLAEEKFLEEKFGPAYLAWANKTPAFIPNPFGWQPPTNPFSWKRVLKREYHTFLTIILSFLFLEIFGDWLVKGRLELDPMWAVIILGSGIIYPTLYFMDKWGKLG